MYNTHQGGMLGVLYLRLCTREAMLGVIPQAMCQGGYAGCICLPTVLPGTPWWVSLLLYTPGYTMVYTLPTVHAVRGGYGCAADGRRGPGLYPEINNEERREESLSAS